MYYFIQRREIYIKLLKSIGLFLIYYAIGFCFIVGLDSVIVTIWGEENTWIITKTLFMLMPFIIFILMNREKIKVKYKDLKNNSLNKDCNISDMIFFIPKVIFMFICFLLVLLLQFSPVIIIVLLVWIAFFKK